jgi:hypothetical protein
VAIQLKRKKAKELVFDWGTSDHRTVKMKIARILDEADGAFGLEYDNTLGKKNTMRLDSQTYDSAIREARSFLGINADDCDADGTQWDIE